MRCSRPGDKAIRRPLDGVASLLVARKAGRTLRSGEEPGSLLEG